MAINIEYAPRGGRVTQAQSQRSNYRPEEEEEEVVNPYVLSRKEGERIAAKLRADRERLGQKQKAEYGEDYFRDTEAGFNWQHPIQIHKPGGGYETAYENLGVDPLATGGFGALGSRETHIDDQAGVIDIADPKDNAKLTALAKRRGSYDININANEFRTPEELEQQKYDREQSRARDKFEFEQKYRDRIKDENESTAYQRKVESDIEKERNRNERQQRGIAARDNFILQERAKGDEAGYAASLSSVRVTLGSILAGESEGLKLSPSSQKKIFEIQTEVDKIKNDADASIQQKSKALDEMLRQLDRIRPDPVRESPEQEMQRRFEEFKQRADYTNSLKPAKPQYSLQQISEAKNAFARAKDRLPTAQELRAMLESDSALLDELNQGSSANQPPVNQPAVSPQIMQQINDGAGGSPEAPLHLSSLDAAEAAAIPPGMFVINPITGQVFRKK